MKTRIVIGALIVLTVAAMFWLDYYWGGYFICLVAMGMTAAGLHELFAMARRTDIRPFSLAGIAFGVTLIPYYLWSDWALPNLLGTNGFVAFLTAPLFALILILMGLASARSEGLGPQLKNIAVTVFAVVYVAMPMTFLVRTRVLDEGWSLVMLVIAVTKASDVGGYFLGTTLGRHKLAPRVSPSKTVEGAVGGLLASTAAAFLMAYGMHIRTLIDLGPLPTVCFGIIVGAASQVGDLTESLIKRSTGAKDSGNLLPAFGGVLDLIDSFLVAAPVAYFVLSIFAKVTVQLNRTP